MLFGVHYLDVHKVKIKIGQKLLYLRVARACGRLNGRVKPLCLAGLQKLFGKIRLAKHLAARQSNTAARAPVIGLIGKDLGHYLINGDVIAHRLFLASLDKSFYLPSLRFGVGAPRASHTAALKENYRSDARSVMY